jgi:hypothetical protein
MKQVLTIAIRSNRSDKSRPKFLRLNKTVSDFKASDGRGGKSLLFGSEAGSFLGSVGGRACRLSLQDQPVDPLGGVLLG